MIDEQLVREQGLKDGVSHYATGVAIVRDGKILLLRRVPNDFLGGVYELPGGGVDDGETIESAAIREAKEETGLMVTKVIAQFPGFDYSTPKKPLVRQLNLLVEAAPGEIQMAPDEHDAYAWVDLESVEKYKLTKPMLACVMHAFQSIK